MDSLPAGKKADDEQKKRFVIESRAVIESGDAFFFRFSPFFSSFLPEKPRSFSD
jgi:hypothetical protein